MTTPERSELIDDLELMSEELEARRRAREIAKGIDPDAPKASMAERRANLAALQERNEADLAVIRRRSTLKVVGS